MEPRDSEKKMPEAKAKFSVSPMPTVASVRHAGSYSTVGESMRELKAWIDSKGIEQSGYLFCLYCDNPGLTGSHAG